MGCGSPKGAEREVSHGCVGSRIEVFNLEDIGSFMAPHPGVGTQGVIKQIVPDIDTVYAKGPVLKQKIGEASGRCSGVDKGFIRYREMPGPVGGLEFLSAPADIPPFEYLDGKIRRQAPLRISFDVSVNAYISAHDTGVEFLTRKLRMTQKRYLEQGQQSLFLFPSHRSSDYGLNQNPPDLKAPARFRVYTKKNPADAGLGVGHLHFQRHLAQ